MEIRPQPQSASVRPAHPVMTQLVGGLELNVTHLGRRDDASILRNLRQMLSNAEYWLSFEMASFEPLLAKSPSPLRELGVAVALRYGEGFDGGLSLDDIARAREQLAPGLTDDLRKGVEDGLHTLERAVRARESIHELEAKGFKRYVTAHSLSVHALRAMGRSKIVIDGHPDHEKRVQVRIGEPVLVTAWDEKGKPLQAPEIESHVDAPLYARDEPETNQRSLCLLVPGEYFVRVPGRATGDRRLLAF